MPISLMKSDQLHLLFVQDPLIVDSQSFLALGNVAILDVDAVVKKLTFLCFSNFTFHM